VADRSKKQLSRARSLDEAQGHQAAMVGRDITADKSVSETERCHVYVIAWSPRGPSKVGIADSVVSRLPELQVACPYRLQIYSAVIVKSVHHARQIERRVLTELAPFRTIGEWLKLTPSIVGQHVWFTAHLVDKNVEKWFATSEERGKRLINLREHARQRAKQRADAAVSEAQTLGLNIKG
jgi:hypothetical protein